MEYPKFAEMKLSDGVYLPYNMDFENIEVVGRKKGIRLFSLSDQDGYQFERIGNYTNGALTTNGSINFKNIQLEYLADTEDQFHLSIPASNSSHETNGFYPAITFENCSNIAILHDGAKANMFFEKSSISNISRGGDQSLKGRFSFNNCEFNPVIRNKDVDVYSLQSTVGTFFTNCVFNEPMYLGEKRADLINKTGVFELNKKVDFYHTNSILSKGIIDFYESTDDQVSTQFIDMLR